MDRRNHHTFQPLLYQVATAGLSPGEIAAPIRWIFRGRDNVEVLLEEVVGFDLDRRLVKTSEQELPYDYLVVAAGASHAYFGHDDWEMLAPGLKTIEDALEIRRRVLLAFELAERQSASGMGDIPLRFVIVGGGPNRRRARWNHRRDCQPCIDPRVSVNRSKAYHVTLIEGGPRVLAAYPEDLSRSAEEQLRRLGVEVRTSEMVTKVEPGIIHIGETTIAASVILWAAGVAASPLGKKLGVPVDRAGRVHVQPDLTLAGRPEVFVIGDLAALN